jgi:hypothetical protein
MADAEGEAVDGGDLTAFRFKILPTLAEALAAKRLPLHTPTQDAVDLPKMVQVVCRFQADELLDRLPSAYLVDPIALHPPCARDRLQQSQVALAQRPKDPCRKARILLRVTQALRPFGPSPHRTHSSSRRPERDAYVLKGDKLLKTRRQNFRI